MITLVYPKGWVSDSLGNLVHISTGKTPNRGNPIYWDNGSYYWATISDMTLGQTLLKTKEKISDIALKQVKPRLVKKGTLLFSFKLTIGKMAFAGCDLYTNEAIAAFVPNNDKRINRKFLYYALQVADLTVNAGDAAKGATLNKKTIPLIEVSFPKDVNEQRRIVSRIEELTCRADEARRLFLEKEAELDMLIRATYQRMIENAEWQPLKQVASLVRRKIDMKPDEEYEEMGIRSFGRGTFKKPVLTGEQVGDKRIYRIYEGDLVFNNVFAWEGAIAVTQPEDHGRVGSHRFITYSPHKGKATAEFLCHHFLSEQGLEAIGAASPGSAGRNRTLGLAKLDNIKVPVPHYPEQVRFEALAKRRRQIRRESNAIDTELKTLQSAIIAKAFRGEL
jgi:type I restriction enzyme S subunit